MARGRMLSTDASVDPELNSLTTDSMLLYLLTIAHLDRDGLIDANPMRLCAMAAPLRPELRDHAGALINEWTEVGIVTRYPTGRNQHALHFHGFRKHNRFEYGKDRPSELPPPPGWFRSSQGLIPEDKETCFRLAATLHPENKYRKALLDYASGEASEIATSRTVLEPSRSPLEPSRTVLEDFSPRSDQIRSDHDDDDDALIPATHRRYSDGGESRGGEPAAPAAADIPPPDLNTIPTRTDNLIAGFTEDELRCAAYQLGSVLNLHMDWTNYSGYLSKRSPPTLAMLLEWISHYLDMPEEVHEKITSLPGIIRSNINQGGRPPLTTRQRKTLIDRVSNAVRLAQKQSP